MKKKKIIITLIVVFVLSLLGILLGNYIQESGYIKTVRFNVKAQEGIEEQVSLYDTDGVYYAFLPSYADFSQMTLTTKNGYSLYIDDVLYDANTVCDGLQTDKTYQITLKNARGLTVAKDELIIKKASNIATLSIHLSDGTIDDINKDKDEDKMGAMSLILPDSVVNFSGDFLAMHGRGNTTWVSHPKKAYAIEFEQPTDLLGMGEAYNWVLLANSFDESSLRNKLVYDVAKDLGVPYAADCEYVDLYIDNEYYGLYLLCEKVEVAPNRVEITDLSVLTQAENSRPLSNYLQYEITRNGLLERGYKIPQNPEDISGGYLLQIEHHASRIKERNSLIQTEDLSFSLTSPKYASEQQIAYISGFMNDIESQLKNDEIDQIDLDSFVAYYLVQEFFANNDNCSVFYYKDVNSDKIYAGTIWDFDLSLGNGWLRDEVNPRALYRNNDNWFEYLYRNEEFKQLLCEKYADVLKANAEEWLYARLRSYVQAIEHSFDMDKLRWQDAEKSNEWTDLSQKRLDTIQEHSARITDFITERLAYLDVVWSKDADVATVSFSSPDVGGYFMSAEMVKGTPIITAPDPQSEDTEGYEFLGWYDDQGNPYVADTVVTDSVQYSARWQSTGSFAKIIEYLTETYVFVPILAVLVFALLIFDFCKNKKIGRRSDDSQG